MAAAIIGAVLFWGLVIGAVVLVVWGIASILSMSIGSALIGVALFALGYVAGRTA